MSQTFTIRKTADGWTNTKAWDEYRDSLPEGRYKVEIKPYKTRSLQQNKYYHSVVVPMVFDGLRDAGFTIRHTDDAHEVLKNLFLKVREEKGGIAIERVRSTTELSTTEFNEYIQFIQVWAIDYLNISIPLPNEQLQIDITYAAAVANYDSEAGAVIIQQA